LAFHGFLSALSPCITFHYAGQNLHCESVDLAEVARLYGTPTYVYSAATIADNYTRLARSLKGLDVRICYAVKANSNLAVLRHFSNLGAAFDFASAGRCAGSWLRARA
jgi:diaminopimelate decarboxylase